MKRNENKLIFEQYKLIKEAEEHALNKIREYIKTLEHEDEMSRIVSVYNNIAIWAARANISDETLKTVLSPEDFNRYQHYYPADLKHPHKDLTLRQDTHYRSAKENNNRLTLQQAINTANKENINHVVYVDVYNSIEDKQNTAEADISDWDDWDDALRYIQSQRLDPNLVIMRGEDEEETMELHITTNDGGRTWELDRYRLGQDSDIEEANTQSGGNKYIVLLGNGDDNGVFGFKAIYSNKQLALTDIKENEYPPSEVEIREVSISSNNPIVAQIFDDEQRHWMYEGIFNDIDTAKAELEYLSDNGVFQPDVHFSQISIDDPQPDLGTKNYGAKIKYTDSL